MTPEQLAALVADHRRAAATFGEQPGAIAKIIFKAHIDTIAAIEHLVAERDALQSEVARLSTPPLGENVSALLEILHSLGDHAIFSPQHHHIAADALTRLSHALAEKDAEIARLTAALSDTADALTHALYLLPPDCNQRAGMEGALRRSTLTSDAKPAPDAVQEAARVPEIAALIEAAGALGVRDMVAGWNGEGREHPYTPHPASLWAKINTTCGAVYALDAALRAIAESEASHDRT